MLRAGHRGDVSYNPTGTKSWTNGSYSEHSVLYDFVTMPTAARETSSITTDMTIIKMVSFPALHWHIRTASVFRATVKD
jgi:hypothetical protein